MRYLQDGRIHIDNNLAENAIRPITLGRKELPVLWRPSIVVSMSVVCSLLQRAKRIK